MAAPSPMPQSSPPEEALALWLFYRTRKYFPVPGPSCVSYTQVNFTSKRDPPRHHQSPCPFLPSLHFFLGTPAITHSDRYQPGHLETTMRYRLQQALQVYTWPESIRYLSQEQPTCYSVLHPVKQTHWIFLIICFRLTVFLRKHCSTGRVESLVWLLCIYSSHLLT